ncbi:MAG: Ig-like domain-containing protein, partial [Methylococcaceae bacterium]
AAINGIGNALDNVLTGNNAANTLTAYLGNDLLDGGIGADTLLGGVGDDTYVVDNTLDVVTENLNKGTDGVQSSVTYTLAGNVENLTLTGTAAINGTGNALDNILTGNNTANILTGDLGNDLLNGGAGADALLGGLGDDTYVVDNTLTVVTENPDEGTDGVQSSVTYTLTGNVENLTLTGTAVNGTGNTLDNLLTGNNAANTLIAYAGNDWLDGGMGADTLQGGLGNDTLEGADGNDALNGGADNDQYRFNLNGGTDQIVDSSGTDRIVFGTGITAAQIAASQINGKASLTVSANNSVSFDILGSGSYAVEQFEFADGSVRGATWVSTLLNTAPTGMDKILTTNEDTAYILDVASFGFSDVDIGDSLSAVRIDSLPVAGNIKLAGVNVVATQVITAANITAGNLVFTPAANATGVNHAGFTFSVEDQYSAFDPSPNTLSFNVTAVNDAPTGANKTITFNEDNSYTFTLTDFGYADIEGNTLASVKITSLPVAGSLKLNGTAVALNQVIASSSIVNLIFLPLTNANGTGYANFNFTVNDGSLDSMSANTISLNVAAVNDAPTGTNKTVSINEDNAYSFASADFGYADIEGSPMASVKITSLPVAGSLKLSGAAVTLNQVIAAASIGNLAFTPITNANANGTAGYANFNFTVNDGSLNSVSTNTITLNVTPVNDAPVLTIPTAINYTDSVFNDSFATITSSLVAGDIDGNTLTYGITGGTDNGNGTISQSNTYGVLTVTKATGAYSFVANDASIEALTVNTGANFALSVSDGLLNDSKTLAINIAQNGTTESTGNDTLTGTSANDKFDGLAGNDVIDGLTGADTIQGGLGNDTYVVDNVGDVVIETSTLATEIDSVNSSVSYTLGANVENLSLTGTAVINGSGNGLANTLIGNTANNLLVGDAGNDTLSGATGNDTLDSGTGNDRLTGGTGLDVFLFTTAPTANMDTITDFAAVDDTIQLGKSIFTKLTTTGVLAAASFVKGAAALDSNDYVIYNTTTGAVTYDADGNGAGVAVQIAVLGVNLALTNADFVII